jgi:hypothetical protein
MSVSVNFPQDPSFRDIMAERITLSSYGKGNDARMVIRLRRSSCKSLTVTLTELPELFSSFKGDPAVMKDCLEDNPRFSPPLAREEKRKRGF